MHEKIEVCKRLAACPIPEGAIADWKNTYHYEVHDAKPGADWWWIYGPECLIDPTSEKPGEEQGERWGALMDYGCAYKRDVQVLLNVIDELVGKPKQALVPGRAQALDEECWLND